MYAVLMYAYVCMCVSVCVCAYACCVFYFKSICLNGPVPNTHVRALVSIPQGHQYAGMHGLHIPVGGVN